MREPRPTTRSAVLALAAIAVALGSSCETTPTGSSQPLAEDSGGWEAHETYRVPAPPEHVRDVMQAKLVHSHAVLEGIMLEDFAQLEANATALVELSRTGAFRVHTTVSYGVLSDEFAATAERLGEHARARDLPAVYRDYVDLTGACLRCHDYLRRERPSLQLPGAVSLASRSRLR